MTHSGHPVVVKLYNQLNVQDFGVIRVCPELDFATLLNQLANLFPNAQLTPDELARCYCLEVRLHGLLGLLYAWTLLITARLAVQICSVNLGDQTKASELQRLLASGDSLLVRPISFQQPSAEAQVQFMETLAFPASQFCRPTHNGSDFIPACFQASVGAPVSGHLRLHHHPASLHGLSLSDCGELQLRVFDGQESCSVEGFLQFLIDALVVSEGHPDYICPGSSNLEVSPVSTSPEHLPLTLQCLMFAHVQVVFQHLCCWTSELGNDVIMIPTPSIEGVKALCFIIPAKAFKNFSDFQRSLPLLVLDLDETLVNMKPFPGLQVGLMSAFAIWTLTHTLDISRISVYVQRLQWALLGEDSQECRQILGQVSQAVKACGGDVPASDLPGGVSGPALDQHRSRLAEQTLQQLHLKRSPTPLSEDR